MEKTVAEIAKILDGEVVGNGSVTIKGVSGIPRVLPFFNR